MEPNQLHYQNDQNMIAHQCHDKTSIFSFVSVIWSFNNKFHPPVFLSTLKPIEVVYTPEIKHI